MKATGAIKINVKAIINTRGHQIVEICDAFFLFLPYTMCPVTSRF